MPTDSPSKTKFTRYLGKTWGIALVIVAGLLVHGAFFESPLEKLLIGTSKKKSQEKKPNSASPEVPASKAEPGSDFVEDAEFDSESPVKKSNRTKAELKQEIISQCSLLTKKLKEVKLPDRYASIELTFHEAKLRKNPVFKDLQYCFFEDSSSKYRLEMDIFSSEFGGRAEDQVQVQVSAFDLGSTNKIYETGFQFHLASPVSK